VAAAVMVPSCDTEELVGCDVEELVGGACGAALARSGLEHGAARAVACGLGSMRIKTGSDGILELAVISPVLVVLHSISYGIIPLLGLRELIIRHYNLAIYCFEPTHRHQV
jgi:hypothetical protein